MAKLAPKDPAGVNVALVKLGLPVLSPVLAPSVPTEAVHEEEEEEEKEKDDDDIVVDGRQGKELSEEDCYDI